MEKEVIAKIATKKERVLGHEKAQKTHQKCPLLMGT